MTYPFIETEMNRAIVNQTTPSVLLHLLGCDGIGSVTIVVPPENQSPEPDFIAWALNNGNAGVTLSLVSAEQHQQFRAIVTAARSRWTALARVSDEQRRLWREVWNARE